MAAYLAVRYSRGMDRDEILRVLPAFEEEGLEYVLIGAAAPSALYQLEKDTVRPLDQQDAEALRQRFDLQEE